MERSCSLQPVHSAFTPEWLLVRCCSAGGDFRSYALLPAPPTSHRLGPHFRKAAPRFDKASEKATALLPLPLSPESKLTCSPKSRCFRYRRMRQRDLETSAGSRRGYRQRTMCPQHAGVFFVFSWGNVLCASVSVLLMRSFCVSGNRRHKETNTTKKLLTGYSWASSMHWIVSDFQEGSGAQVYNWLSGQRWTWRKQKGELQSASCSQVQLQNTW